LELPGRTVTYTGQPHSLAVRGLAEDATVSYTIGGAEGNSATDAGNYEVTATVSRENHADETLTGTLTIDRAAAFILGDENQVHTYDGTAKALALALNHDEGTLVYSPGNSFTDAGTYVVDVSAARTANYEAVSKTFTLRIDRATVGGITLDDAAYTYNGTAQALAVAGDLPAGASVAYTIDGEPGNSATDAGSYEVTATISGDNHETRELIG